jgi:hypothetical protein
MRTPFPTIRSASAAAALAISSSLLAACGGAGSSLSPATGLVGAQSAARTENSVAPAATKYTFTTLDDQADLTFNQLLGINDSNVIAGYYGIGSKTHPNKGYTLTSPYGQTDYTNENFPGSFQTQVTGINNSGNTCGFWVDKKGNSHGWTNIAGTFTSWDDPSGIGTTQFLGINDHSLVVGFYVDGSGLNHGFTLNLANSMFAEVDPPSGGSNLQATGINDMNDVTGFYTTGSGAVESFILKMKTFHSYAYPGSTNTTALGLNEKDEMVGAYVDSSNAMHGFTLTNPIKKPAWQSIDDPNGVGTTTVNGINTAGDLVGFYVDSSGNTDGMLAVKK